MESRIDGKVRRNSLPYAHPTSGRLAEEALRTRPIGEIQRNATQSATSVDLASVGLRNASSGVSITFRDGRGNLRSSSTTNSETSRVARPYITHYSDSGFSSTLSSGSSFSYLPPPPPYRFRSATSGSDGVSESSISGATANGGSTTPRLISLNPGAIRICGAPLNPEICPTVEESSLLQQSQFLHFQQISQQFDTSPNQHQYQKSLQPQHFNLTNTVESIDFGKHDDSRANIPVAHRIHRSLSDSKYGHFEPSSRHSRLSTATVVGAESGNSMISPMASYDALQNYASLRATSSLQSTNKMGNSDPYVGNRGSSWTNSRISLASYQMTFEQKLSPSPSMSTVSCPEYPELQEKLRRLALTRDTLSLQVDVLNDQVVAQKEKIRDLESLLDNKRKMYSYETLSEHPSASNQAGLLREISELKNRFATVQREKAEAEKRLQNSQTEIERLTTSIQTLMNQYNIPVQKLLHMSSTDENQEMEQLRQVVQRLMADNEKKKLEINSLRNQLESTSGRGSDSAIEENGASARDRSTPTTHQKQNGTSPTFSSQFQQKANQPFDINTQLRKLLVDDVKENMAHSSSFPASLCNSVHPPSSHHFQQSGHGFLPRSQIQPSTSYLSSLSANATPSTGTWDMNAPRHQLHHTTSMFAQPTQPFTDRTHNPTPPTARQLAAELDEILRGNGDLHQLPPHANNLFATTSLPRSLHSKSNSTLNLSRSKLTAASSSAVGGEFLYTPSNPQYAHQYPLQPRRGSSLFGSSAIAGDGSLQMTESVKSTPETGNFLQRWLGRSARNLHVAGPPTSKTTSGKQSLSKSTPNLAPRGIAVHRDFTQCSDSEAETDSDDEMTRSRIPSVTTSNGKFKRGRTRSTLRNIFGKLTRSTSQEIRAPNLSRGISARVVSLGAPLTGNIPIRPLVNQFCDWSTEVVCEWLAEVGFGQYIPDAERSIRSGRHLLNMTNAELEKEVGIKPLMHRKKLRCLLNCIERNTSNTLEAADRMDVHQVMLWLDDIGLPQLRDVFAENMIDGQMLLCLTVQDLVEMKIVTAMNHATIARAIQFLRSVDFSHQRMIKSFKGDVTQMDKCPDEVEKWAHSCVVQWLKEIDLKEFTQNLMFSGIHGALMVHDPTFTAESLSEVLQIPPHKTLLRRHLSSHFNKILGQEIISYKRELLTQPNVTFLTPSLRIRLVKKGFSLGRKGKNEIFVEPDLPVCPTDVSMLLNTSRSSNSFMDTSNV
ncbi:hypothetical protein M3Y98_00366200 [Aphelenchoides besseyi]|nr:hypothetical protein M3Y98_00366200 [Aphelenchoides besseyi]